MKKKRSRKEEKGFFGFRKKVQTVKTEDRVLSNDTPFIVREAYKSLRTNLVFSLASEEKKVFLITSSGKAEGKTTNCLNVAITFAETGAKVCVLDCDLRKPSIARLCGEKGSPGLSNVLAGLNDLDSVIRSSKYENLDFVFSGDIPPNPAELLVSGGMKKVLETLSERYDYVFVDTPPVNVVTDASLLAGMVSGVLLLANQQSTSQVELARAISQLEFVQAKILGVIFNGVKFGEGRHSYRYHNYNYYYETHSLSNGER